MPESEGLSAIGVGNYPMDCYTRFLGATRKGHVARKTDIDKILDDALLWWSVFGEGKPFTFSIEA
jgi:hypothetical protein